MAEVVHHAGVVGHGVVRGDIEHVAAVHGALHHRGHVVGVGKGILRAGIAQLFQLGLHGVHLILAVGLGRAIDQTHGLGLGAPLLNHGRLLVQRRQVGGAGHVGAHQAGKVADLQRHAVFGNRGAQHGDGAGGRGGRLQRRGGVGQNQIHVVGHKAVDDGGAGGALAGGVLLFKGDAVAQRLGQGVFKALGGGVKRHVGGQLANADHIGCFAGFRGVLAAGGQRTHKQRGAEQRKQFFLHGFRTPISVSVGRAAGEPALPRPPASFFVMKYSTVAS